LLEAVNKYLFGVAVPVFLLICGVFYCFELRFFHFFKVGRILRVLTKKNTDSGTSPIKAVSLALAGTLGVGNIVGVSAAIALGGFGAVFWMWVSALAAMLLKYAEIVLAMRYRRFDNYGRPHGSAMYYIKEAFARLGARRLGGIAAGVFALLCLVNALTMGSMVQINAVEGALDGVFGVPPTLVSFVIAAMTAVALLFGTKGILKLTEALVPIMTVGYIAISFAVFALRLDSLGEAFALIFKNAFSADAAVSGIGGYFLSGAVRFGVMRGIVSNEAGCGTAPAAHAVSNCKSPAEQGVWGIFEVFADTILLCTMTALVVIVGYEDAVLYKGDFMMMTISAYASVLGDYAAVFLAIAVLLFGTATVLCWAHYGRECAIYFVREKNKKKATLAFGVAYCVSILASSVVSADLVWQATDLAVGAMTLINLTALVIMYKEVKKETNELFY